MSNNTKTIGLKKQIIRFRKKLDSLLETQSTNSETVLDISRKLDMLINEYYKMLNEK